jgi:hypothetical protein
VDIVWGRLTDPFQKAPLADDRNAVFSGAAKFVGRATIVQQGPSKLADDEKLGALCDCRARRSAMLPNHFERFGAAHARKPPREGD